MSLIYFGTRTSILHNIIPPSFAPCAWSRQSPACFLNHDSTSDERRGYRWHDMIWMSDEVLYLVGSQSARSITDPVHDPKRRKEALSSHFRGIQPSGCEATPVQHGITVSHMLPAISRVVPTDQVSVRCNSRRGPTSPTTALLLLDFGRAIFGQLRTAGTTEPYLKRFGLSLRQSCHPRGGFLPAPRAS